jgi:hypothetical protein
LTGFTVDFLYGGPLQRIISNVKYGYDKLL